MLRQTEALQVVEDIELVALRRVLRLFYRRAVRRVTRGISLPVTDLDLLYYVEGILRFCGSHRMLQSIFAGNDVNWDAENDKRHSTFCPLPNRPLGEFVGSPNGWTWVARIHEATWFGETIQDLALLQLVTIGVFAMARGPLKARFDGELPTSDRKPDAPIDLLFCAEIICELCRWKQRLGRDQALLAADEWDERR